MKWNDDGTLTASPHELWAWEQQQRHEQKPPALRYPRTITADVLVNHRRRPGQGARSVYLGERHPCGEEHETKLGRDVLDHIERRVLGGFDKGVVHVGGVEYSFEVMHRE